MALQMFEFGGKERAVVEIRFPQKFTGMLVRMKDLQPENCLASNIWIKQTIGRIDELHTAGKFEKRNRNKKKRKE